MNIFKRLKNLWKLSEHTIVQIGNKTELKKEITTVKKQLAKIIKPDAESSQ